MSNSTVPSYHQPAFRTALIFTIIHIAFTLTLLFVGFQIGVIEMQQTAMVTITITLTSGIGALLIRYGRTNLGGWLTIGGIVLATPLISLFTTNFGWISLITIPLAVAWIARQAFSTRVFPWALLIGIVSGVVALLLDLYGAPERAAMPLSQFIIPAIVTALALLLGYFLIRQFQFFTLQTKLLILFLAVALIPLSLLAYIENRSTRETLIASANQTLFSTGTLTANRIDIFFRETTQSLQAEAQFTGFREYLTNIANGDFAFSGDAVISMGTLASKDPDHILTYALVDRDGGVQVTYPVTPVDQNVNVVDTVPPFLGVSPAVETGMRTSLASGSPYISPVLFDAENRPSIIFVTPVYDILDHTNPVGLLLVEYNAIVLQEIIEDQNGLAGSESFGVLFDDNQVYLAHGTDPSQLYKSVAPLSSEKAETLIETGRLPNLPLDELTTNQPELPGILSNAREEPFAEIGEEPVNQVAITQMETKRWQVAFSQPQDVFLVIVEQQTRDAILIVFIIASIVAISSVGATRLLASPIINLTELVEHVAAGNLSLQIPSVTQDEIGRLATAFNALTAQIRSLLGGLELQVAERTQELERQTIQLQTAAEVARDASNLQDLDELLDRTVDLIQDRFGFYHAGIFLLDDRKEFAILRSANSEGGKEMLRQGHKLKVGQTGLVGYTTSIGEPRIALDVDADSTHFAHPLLPETRSEMALPLIIGERIIGALDVQSKEANAFDESDITVLQVLADQLAVAIENAQLLAEVRQTVFELQTAYGEFTQESWQRWIQQADRVTGYRYRGTNIEPTTEQSTEAALAVKQGQIITQVPNDETVSQSALAVPIRLRDQTLGVINLRFDGNEIPPEIITVVDTIANRLATTLDSARLYEESQRRAAQEQLTSEIVSQIRGSLDINAVLKTAAQEIGEKLSLHDITIQLGTNHSTPERES